ncbi:hypothetical protein JAAARDRAFT_52392 [Jaapia argillacea MUCL 33604]|uniref:Hepatocellular carcinoma-associated antigen 59 domain-containing protein n=1 Tax=Jaapia argillacea MUCL 33604 TaxID=933084 RepID=A0A067QBM5_9AGAM|nr:hypothetical protein JAAARDRAFT_52392 [Jaapia argillacea MUCL 33604]
MIKKRTRPQPRLRQPSPEPEADKSEGSQLEGEDLIELRKLRRTREGIDVAKLNKGDAKKKKKRVREEEEVVGGLKKGVSNENDGQEEEEEEEDDKESKARKAVRSNNFTQQTDALDVDKHMMAYIEENMKARLGNQPESEEKDEGPADPYAELYRITSRYKFKQNPAEEGNVTSSMAMLTAIPEVDLGMDVRLKNIEETEKAKRMVAEQRQERSQVKPVDESQIPGSRFYRPNQHAKSDADIMRDAKLEAMGLPPQEEHRRPHHERAQMATDEMVMERFKKRMRK